MPTLKRALKNAAASGKKSLRSCEQEEGGDNLSRELAQYTDISTSYGKLLKRVELSDSFSWLIACPFALLWKLCQINKRFAHFIMQSVPSKVGKLVLYTDGTTPGSNIVAWREREITVFYWTISDLPAWYRKRKHGWFILGYLRTSIIKEFDGGLSFVCGKVLKTFFGDGFNFAKTGMLLVDSNVDFRLQLRLSCFLQDGAAHKHVASIKGASGTVCCPLCVNILNTDPERLASAGITFYHYATAKPSDFKEQTHELFYHNADALKAMSKRDREFAEKAFGIVYSPQSVIYDDYLRTIYSVPLQTYLDPMHILLASSGLAQWELNQFVRHANMHHQLDLDLLDQFALSIQLPEQSLQQNFFSKMQSGPKIWPQIVAHVTPQCGFMGPDVAPWGPTKPQEAP